MLGNVAGAAAVSPAVLNDWRAVRVRSRTYPVIVPAEGNSVTGVLLTVPRGDARAVTDLLVAFEGREYVLTELTVSTGAVASAFTASRQCRATSDAWSFDRWERRDKRAFLEAIGQARVV